MPNEMLADTGFGGRQTPPVNYSVDDMPGRIVDSADGQTLRTKRCLKVFVVAGVIALVVFLLTGEEVIAAALLGSVVLVLSLVDTTFALAVLYFLLPLESAMMISPTFSPSKAMGIVVFVSFVVTSLGRRKLVFPAPFKAMLALAVLATLSIGWALSSLMAALGVMTLLLHLGLILILVNTVRTQAVFRIMMWALVVGGALAALLIVTGVATHTSSHEAFSRTSFGGEEGSGPNALAACLVLCFMAVIYQFLDGGAFRKVLMLLLVPLLLLAVLKTQARAALGTAFLAPLVAFVFAATGRKRLTYGIAAIALSCVGYGLIHVALSTDILPRAAKERFRDSRHNIGESGRTYMWRAGIKYLKERPIHGWGWKNFHIRSGGGKLAAAHNNLISLAAELGMLGTGICVAIYLLLVLGILRTSYVPLRWLGLAFIVSSLATGFTMTTYFQKHFWYAIGFAMVIATLERRNKLAVGSG